MSISRFRSKLLNPAEQIRSLDFQTLEEKCHRIGEVNPMNARELRLQAERYRQLTKSLTDPIAIEALFGMADDLEERARRLDAKENAKN